MKQSGLGKHKTVQMLIGSRLYIFFSTYTSWMFVSSYDSENFLNKLNAWRIVV